MADPFEGDPELKTLVSEKKPSLSELIGENVTSTAATKVPAPAATLTLEQKRIRELEDQLAKANVRKLDNEDVTEYYAPATSDNRILIHFVEDGGTALGKIWARGQELEFDVPSEPYDGTKDRFGQSWLDFDENEQMRRYGKVRFRRGPWPGKPYEDNEAAQAERVRKRAAPKMPSILR